MSSSNSFGKKVAVISGIVGIIVSCITVFSFVTGVVSLNLFGRNQSTNYSQTNENVYEYDPEVNTDNESSAFSEEIVPTPTPFGVRNPTSPVQAGIPILVDDYSLIVQGDYVTGEVIDDAYIGIGTVLVQNLGNSKHLFRFQRSSITLEDDLGNKYQPETEGEDLYRTISFDLDPGEIKTFKSVDPFINNDKELTVYNGPVSPQANKLIITFNGFGPFNAIQVELDL